MKILQLTTHINIGGIGNYVYSLSKALKAKDVGCVVASAGGDLESELEKLGIAQARLDIKTKSELSPKVLKSIFAVRSLIGRESIDLIHAHTRVSQVVARLASGLAKIPYVTTCHGYFRKRMRKVFDTWGAKVIAISDAVKEHLEDDFGLPGGRIALIYNGIDLERFRKDYSDVEKGTVKRSLGLKEGPVIGTIGRFSDVKGQRFLIEAMKGITSRRRDAQCVLVGGGPEELNLRKLAKTLGLEGSIRFVEPALDTERLLAIMDVFVFPSVKEGLGIALLEALASGKACAASDVGGIGNIIKDGSNGLLFKVGDVKAIEGAVMRLLDDKRLRDELGRSGRESMTEKYSLDVMADKVVGVYEEVIRGSGT